MVKLNRTSGHKSPLACEHKAFVVHHDVQRLARTEGGPIEQFVFAGNVFCFDCGMEFEAFRVLMKPTSSIARALPSQLREAHTTKQ